MLVNFTMLLQVETALDVYFTLYCSKKSLESGQGYRCLEKKPEDSKARSFTKSNNLPWLSSVFFKLYKWYQIAQSISFNSFQEGVLL